MKKIYVVGIGPGNQDDMTFRAHAALEQSDVLVGYRAYIDLIRPLFPEKPAYDTDMTQEIDRCKAALSLANEGKTVAVVCSGDAGVYGMAGLICELSPGFPDVAIEVVPGVTAALSGAALLGAPLTHDFSVISLSDHLTTWTLIEKRLIAAAEADFCIALYNPGSKTRADYLQKACGILLAYKSPETVCGVARNVGRVGEETEILTLAKLRETPVDMFTTVFVGNCDTKVLAGRMVTPRGYRLG